MRVERESATCLQVSDIDPTDNRSVSCASHHRTTPDAAMGSEHSSAAGTGDAQSQQDQQDAAVMAQLNGQTWKKPKKPLAEANSGMSTEPRKEQARPSRSSSHIKAAGQSDEWEHHVPQFEDQTDGATEWLST